MYNVVAKAQLALILEEGQNEDFGGHFGNHIGFFGVTMDTYLIFNNINEFLDLQNILLNTRIIFLCAILRDIWMLKGIGDRFGGHYWQPF